MGQSLGQDSFSQSDKVTFKQRLHQQVELLKEELQHADYAAGEASIGAELEMYLVDASGQPVPRYRDLLALADNPLFQAELNQYNLEFNLSPVAAKGQPFSAMMSQLRTTLEPLEQQAKKQGIQLVAIGILPTLQADHLQRQFMTDLPRYRALSRELLAFRGKPFEVNISAQDQLQMQGDEVTLEGANTSFQLHLKVPSPRFADYYNAAQLITPLVLAVSGNSPVFLGKRLWQETRIALFKQAIDNRLPALTDWRQPARVSYGNGWLRRGAWEMFAENAALHPVLLPYVSQTQQAFSELLVHHGTVWSWNRAVFQPGENRHLRIEFRALPAGPTYIDMMANAAFMIGLTHHVMQNIERYISRLPFHYAEYNFYRAAQFGLDAHILWPQIQQDRPTEVPVHRVIARHLDYAAQGLSELGVASGEITHLISVIEARLANRQTGAQWQLKTLAGYQQRQTTSQALQSMLQDYMVNMHSQQPVSSWPLAVSGRHNGH